MMGGPNPFEYRTGPCFVAHTRTGRPTHHACAGVLTACPAPTQPGDPPEKIRWRYGMWRCPCPCGHPELAQEPEALPTP